jgi:hypothetical protein
VEDRGFEPPAQVSGKRTDSQPCGAQSGAAGSPAEIALQIRSTIDVDLVAVIQAWPSLPEAIRAAILVIVQGSCPAMGDTAG